MQTQELPPWLSYSTFTDESGSLTTGIVQLPLTYYGPSIPLSWPWVQDGDSQGAMRVSLLGGTGYQTLSDSYILAPTQTVNYDQAGPVAQALPTSVADQTPGTPALLPIATTSLSLSEQQASLQTESITLTLQSQVTILPAVVVTVMPNQVTTLPAASSQLANGDWTLSPIKPQMTLTLPDGKQWTETASFYTNEQGSVSLVFATPPASSLINLGESSTLNAVTPSDAAPMPASSSFLVVSSTSSSMPNFNNNHAAPPSPGQIVGIVLGVVAFVALLAGLCGLCFFARRQRRMLLQQQNHPWQPLTEMQETYYFDDDEDTAVFVPPGGRAEQQHYGAERGHTVVDSSTTGMTMTTYSDSIPSQQSNLFYTLPTVARGTPPRGAKQSYQTPSIQSVVSEGDKRTPNTVAFPPVSPKDDMPERGYITVHRNVLASPKTEANELSPPMPSSEEAPLLSEFDELGHRRYSRGGVNTIMQGLGLAALFDKTIWRNSSRNRRAASLNDAYVTRLLEADEDGLDQNPLVDCQPDDVVQEDREPSPLHFLQPSAERKPSASEMHLDTQSLMGSVHSRSSLSAVARNRRAVSEGY